MVPSIYHTWYYTTLLGRQRECQLFRDEEPSLHCALIDLHLSLISNMRKAFEKAVSDLGFREGKNKISVK